MTSQISPPPAGPGRGARVRQERARPDHRLRRRQPARQRHARRRHLPHRHHAVGKAQYRPGDPGLGTQTCASSAASAPSSARTRSSARRSTSPPCWQGAPATFKSLDAKFKEFPGMKYTLQVAPEDCTGCALCVEVCPAKDKTQVGRKAINMAASAAPPRDGEGQLGLLPDPARSRPHPVQPDHGQEFPAAPAAVRVLRRLRRLRRDPLRQAGLAALRRPHGHRQRHRLLLDLRRQPAHHPVGSQQRRPRPGLVELAVRRQRRVRPGHAPDPR